MKALILHHLEPYWDDELIHKGLSYREFVELAVKHIKENNYDKVILNYAHYHNKEEPLKSLINDWNNYGYGFTVFPENIVGSTYSDNGTEIFEDIHGNLWFFDYNLKAYLLDEWMFNLEEYEVFIGGAFDGRCVFELETALNVLGVEFIRVEELIV